MPPINSDRIVHSFHNVFFANGLAYCLLCFHDFFALDVRNETAFTVSYLVADLKNKKWVSLQKTRNGLAYYLFVTDCSDHSRFKT